MKFSEIAKDLRSESGLSQMELSKKIGISAAAIGFLELGKHEPNGATIIAYAKHFEVSADYLLGLEDDYGAKVATPPPATTVSDKEKALLEAFRQLLPETQDFILRTAQSLKDKRDKLGTK